MSNSLHSPEAAEKDVNDAESYQQIELPIKLDIKSDFKIAAIHELLVTYAEKLDKQQEFLGYLSQGNIEVLMAVNQQAETIPIEAIEAIKQEMKVLSQGVITIYQHLDKDSLAKELKAGQQNLQKMIEANQNKTTHKVGYLDWKQIATIITATAIVSSLCSLAVFQLASNLKVDQKTLAPTEKILKPKIKKTS